MVQSWFWRHRWEGRCNEVSFSCGDCILWYIYLFKLYLNISYCLPRMLELHNATVNVVQMTKKACFCGFYSSINIGEWSHYFYRDQSVVPTKWEPWDENNQFSLLYCRKQRCGSILPALAAPSSQESEPNMWGKMADEERWLLIFQSQRQFSFNRNILSTKNNGKWGQMKTYLISPLLKLLSWVVEHMGDSPKKTSLQSVLSAGKTKVSFLPYDWSSNSSHWAWPHNCIQTQLLTMSLCCLSTFSWAESS